MGSDWITATAGNKRRRPSSATSGNFKDRRSHEEKTTFSQNPQRVERDPEVVPDPRERLPLCADAGQHVEGVPEEGGGAQA